MVNENSSSAERWPPVAAQDGAWALEWARARQLVVPDDGDLTPRPLPGGISSLVVAIGDDRNGVVVKRSQERLRAAAEWHADPRRIETEARALSVFSHITPDRVPEVLDIDPATHTIAMRRAPPGTRVWRSALLDAESDPAIGSELGRTVGAWHRATWLPWAGASAFSDRATFEDLRLRPFHEAVARGFPAFAETVEAHADELRRSRMCLIHGDLSPKNVLVAPTCLWIIDPEVAHIGDPVFDVAFLGAHLVLGAVVRPSFIRSLDRTWRAFLDAYLAVAPPARIQARVTGHVGCLLLARTDGLSPEPGLSLAAIERVRNIGRAVLSSRRTLPQIWEDLVDGID